MSMDSLYDKGKRVKLQGDLVGVLDTVSAIGLAGYPTGNGVGAAVSKGFAMVVGRDFSIVFVQGIAGICRRSHENSGFAAKE